MSADLVEESYAFLQSHSDDIHWFCPRTSADDDTPADIEEARKKELENDEKPNVALLRKFEEAEGRKKAALDVLFLLAFDSGESEAAKVWLTERIKIQLGRCDNCVFSYHQGKIKFLQAVREQHDEEAVEEFIGRVNQWDLDRIQGGLTSAEDELNKAMPLQRTFTALKASSIHAILEALVCEAAVCNDQFLSQHFDKPFKLCQTTKPLKLSKYMPSMGYFLFSSNPERFKWANMMWNLQSLPAFTIEVFDWAIRQPLHDAIMLASNSLDVPYLTIFWRGMKIITRKLSKELVTHSLRAMDGNVYLIGLSQFQFPEPFVLDILAAYDRLLTISPTDYWEALGSISPTTIVESVYRSPYINIFLKSVDTKVSYDNLAVQLITSWLGPLMNSLQPSSQPAACRAIARQFMDHLQEAQFPETVRSFLLQTGFSIIARTLETLEHALARTKISVSPVVITEVLEVVESFKDVIFTAATTKEANSNVTKLSNAASDVLRYAFALDCRRLANDVKNLLHENQIHHKTGFSDMLWSTLISRLSNHGISLAQSVFPGLEVSGTIEEITVPNHASPNHKAQVKELNSTVSKFHEIQAEIFRTVGDFSPKDLDLIFASKATGLPVIAALFSSNDAIFSAAVQVIKNVSAESTRPDALGHLMKSSFQVTMQSLTLTIQRICAQRTFASFPRLLKTGGDVLDAITNFETGILRIKTFDPSESAQVAAFWDSQWMSLRVVFIYTEKSWGRNYSKDDLKEFCRDTIQYAERLFDDYSIFSNAMDSAARAQGTETKSSSQNNGKDLLNSPTSVLDNMVKWLRLVDSYLVNIVTRLVCKLLTQLAQLGMIVNEETLIYIGMIVTAKTKSNLLPTQKAELRQALERFGTRESESSQVENSKSTKSSQSSNLHSHQKIPKQKIIDLDSWRSKSSSNENAYGDVDDDDMLIAIEMSMRPKKTTLTAPKTSGNSTSTLNPLLASGRKTFREKQAELETARRQRLLATNQQSDDFRRKRELEREEKKRRDLAQIARMKGKDLVNPLNSGAGSALKNLSGVVGKDHTPSNGLMVDSDDSSEDDSDDSNRSLDELFGTPKKTKKSKVVQEIENNKIQSMKRIQLQGPTKKTKLIRSHHDMRARLAPNLRPLHETILGWNFFHNGDFPPNSTKDDYTLVDNKFAHPKSYQETFTQLHALEAWQGILKAKEELISSNPFEIKIATRATVDSFIELNTSVSMAEGKDLGLGEADIILISKGSHPVRDAKQANCLARVNRINRKKGVMEITYKVLPGNSLISALNPGVTLKAIKVTSITPLEREYGALSGLPFYDLCEEILKGEPSPLLPYTSKTLDPIAGVYKVNTAQAKAIKSAMENDCFTLIQGPPGSGKTKTIVAIVGALLTGTFVDKGVAINRPPQAQGGFNTPKTPAKKLLVCAPSNAAVDELVKRFKEGIKTVHGEFKKISVVRLGKSDAIDARVADVTLDFLVDQKLELAGNKNKAGDEIYTLTQKHKAKTAAITDLREQLDALRAKGESNQELEKRFEIEKRERKSLSDQLDKKRDASNSIQREADINRRRIQQEILEGANVICATLSGSGHDMFQNMNVEFETVVIDEAAQSVELSALIPLKYGCSKCILVGDPKQLPPTVLSREAARLQYEQSLFVRMQRNFPDRVHLLDTQYRMHPEISRFPSINFYDGKLLNGPDMAKLRAKPWHAGELLGPYRFFDVQGQQKSAVSGHSMLNMAEVNIAVQLFDRLVKDFPKANLRGKVGIITPYRAQLRELRTKFSQKYGESIFETIEFNSTDAYQGRESEIIIFSCVRASDRGIGFVGDIRRMNVGLTRAKSSLWILGNSKALFQNEFWGNLIQDARNRHCYSEGNLPALLQKPSVIKNGGGYQSSSSDQDVDMTDADPAPVDLSRSRNIPLELWPSGGAHGLAETQNCKTCGSSDHSTPYCDNVEAKAAFRHPCSRCQSLDHHFSNCKVLKCVTCGNLGHAANACTNSKPLRPLQQKSVKNEEHRFEQNKIKAQEKAARARLGDHDPKVPLIKVASSNENSKESKNHLRGGTDIPTGPKRKRESSPPSPLKGSASHSNPLVARKSKNSREHTLERENGREHTQSSVNHNNQRTPDRKDIPNDSKVPSKPPSPTTESTQPPVPSSTRPIHKIKKRKANNNPMMMPKPRTRK